MQKSIQKIDYDARNDILYVNFVQNSISYGDEHGGVVLLRDMDTDDITGITILSPKNHKIEREKDLKEIASTEGFVFDLSQCPF